MSAHPNCPICGAAREPAVVAAIAHLQQISEAVETLRAAFGLFGPGSHGAHLAAAAAPWVHEVAAMVATEHNVPLAALMADIRSTPAVRPRFLLIWVLSQVGCFSSVRIGQMLNRDHTSVLHAVRRVNQWRKQDTVTLEHSSSLLRRAQAIRDRSLVGAVKEAAA